MKEHKLTLNNYLKEPGAENPGYIQNELGLVYHAKAEYDHAVVAFGTAISMVERVACV